MKRLKKPLSDNKSDGIKLLLLITILSISLAVLYINRTISYNRYDRIQFTSSGETLYANLYHPSHSLSFQSKHPLLIYAHGIGGQKDMDLRIPIEFTKRGFFVAALDYQGHGESGGNLNNINPETNVPAIAEDCSKLLDAIERMSIYTSKINSSQIGLIGHSLGGMIVLMNGALDNRFNATVAWAPLVDPDSIGFDFDPRFNDYFPVNLLNSSNSEDLLIIAHVNDPVVPYSSNALVAQQLTGCELINITESVIDGGHILFTNEVLIESIHWFEETFFHSETINGPISLSFLVNYILIFFSFIMLILTVLSLISFSSRFFSFEEDTKNSISKGESVQISKEEKRKQEAKIFIYISGFLLNLGLFLRFFGLRGLLLTPLIFFSILTALKLTSIYRTPKNERKRIKVKEILKSQVEGSSLAYSLLSTGFYTIMIIMFTIFYPFLFMWPADPSDFLLALLAYPLFLSLEIFYRKVIYPELYYVKSKRGILISLAAIVQAILFILMLPWAFSPAILFVHFIFFLVIVFNTIIFEKTQKISSGLIVSFFIIQIFSSAIISTALGIYPIMHTFG